MNSFFEMANALASRWLNGMWPVIWQSAALAGLIYLLTLCLRRASAAVCFWLWMLVPLRLLVMPLITISLPLLPAATPLSSTDIPIESVPATTVVAPPMADMVPESVPIIDAPAPVSLTTVKLAAASHRVWPSAWTFLMAGWLAGVAFWSVRLLRSWCRIRRIARHAAQVSDDNILAVAKRGAAMLGLGRVPRILVTEEKVSPFLFGVLRPVLVVPTQLVGKVRGEELFAVFAHEFAHLRRRDPLIGWVLAVCEALYFFHPVFHFVKRRILFERERACDDWVIGTSKTGRGIYAHALINAADVCRSFRTKVGPVGAVAESFGGLKKRILAIGSNLKPRARLSFGALILLVIIGAICVPGIVLTARSEGESERTDAQVGDNKDGETRSNADAHISFISADEGEDEKNYRWGVTRTSPLKVIQGWYEFDGQGIRSHGGGGRKVAETRPMQLTLRVSKENGFLLLHRGYAWSSTAGDQQADIAAKIEWPAGAVLKTYYLSEPAGLTDKLQPVWKGELVQDATVIKSVVYAVRVVGQNVSDELFDAGTTSEALRIGRAWAPSPDPAKTRYEGRTIEQWIAQWDSRSYDDTRAATEALTRIGRPAVPAMIELMKQGGSHATRARTVLGNMGPQAEQALDWLIETALDKKPTAAQDKGRINAVICLSYMTWAADRLMPVFKEIAEDRQADTGVRRVAISGLQRIGDEAMPILQKIADSEQGEIRDSARSALSERLAKQGVLSRQDYYTQLVEEDPFDPSVPRYLTSTKGIVNYGKPHALTNKVKALYRQCLKENPDPGLAWRLATIIQNGLRSTELEWAAPTDSSRSKWNREDPGESFATLAEVLELGFRHAEPRSELWLDLGVSLAKLRLLQGNWDEMNATLTKLGQEPIPETSRQRLPAPPVDWTVGLRSQWQIADESMRSGNCSLEFRFEKDGRGLKGVHVLVKRAPEPTNVFRTGIAVDTLFYAPHPIESYRDSFGYRGSDREETRYAVSDESGIVRFDRLPDIPIKVEVLVPTSNFAEAGSSWDLWMEVEPGEFKIAKIYGADAVSPRTPPAVVTLKQGQTVRYPKLVVRPAFGLNVKDWDRADKDNFVLRWQGLSTRAKEIHYELEMSLSAPSQDPDHTEAASLKVESTKQILAENQWPVGSKGVDGMRLEPGNIYMFEVKAVDESGTVVARWPKTRVWVPWGYRQSNPPTIERDLRNNSPIYNGVWFRGRFSYGDGREETLPERVSRFLRERPDAFEHEYVRMGKAWLNWHAGDTTGARRELEDLARELPKGNLARGTAVWLSQQMDDNKEPPKRLNFVPDRETGSPNATSLPDEKTGVQVEVDADETFGRLVDNSAFFTPPITRLVNDTGERKDSLIDFDNNKLFSPPSDFYSRDREQQELWTRENGIDASATVSDGAEGLWGEEMVVIPVANVEFDRMTASSFRESLARATAGTPAVMTAIGELPRTYVFKTREGGMGLLRILEVQREQAPRHIKIRYKMVPRTVESDTKITSNQKLQDLGKAMVSFAQDHKRTLPDSLQEFAPYLRNKQDIEWLSQNVEYLGKGITEAYRPDTVIAYDKSLLELGQGTNVLVLDAHVEYVQADRLKQLGIKPSPKTAVRVEVLTDRPPVALDLDSGELMRLDNGWPDEYDVAWDNDAGGTLFTEPDGPVKMLPIVTAENFADALSIAVQKIESLKIRGVRGVFAEQCKYILISTSQDNIAVAEIEEFDESRAKIRWQMIQQPIGKTGVQLEYERSGTRLEFRIAPEVASTELSPEETDRYNKDLIENGPWAAKQGGDKFAWFEMKSGVTLSGPLIIEECGGDKYLLLHNDEPFVMLPEQGWGLQQVTVPKDQMGRPAIGLEFDQKGSELLYELTKANLRKALAIILNGKVVSSPTIQSAVRNNAIITGNFTDQEVQQMAEALRKGMPPATRDAPQKTSERGSSQGKVLDPEDFCTYALGVWNKPFNVLSQRPDDWWVAFNLDFADKEDVWVKLSKLGFSTDADPRNVFEKAGRGDLCVPEPSVVLTLRGTVMAPLKVPKRKNATEQLFGRITRMKVGQVLEQIREYCSTQRAEQTRRFHVQPGEHYALLRTDGLLAVMEIYEDFWAQFVPLGFISTQKTGVQAEAEKIGASLFEGIDIGFSTEQAKGKKLLVCFWDMNQRPSRRLVTELAKRADKLQAKDIVTLAVQTSDVDADQLKAWLNKYQVAFACGVIKKDVDKVLYRWRARALPWLVLMDEKGVVRAEGFTLEYLDAVLEGKVSAEQMAPEKGAGLDKVVLKLTDSDGWPVAGAQVGTNVDTRDVSTLGRKLSFSLRGGEHNISSDWGEIVLTREKLFLPSWPADVKTLLYVLHEDRNIGAVCEISRDDPRREIPLTLEPVCHVHGKLDSEGLKKVGRPLTWSNVYLSWNRDSFGILSHTSEEQRFEFFVPPGKYELDAYGSGEGASTESVHPKIEVEAGQSELDLGIIDLPATKVTSLIGQPAPEWGPIKAWKNGPLVKLADLRGKLVILHFGGGYPSTSRDLPRLVELHEQLQDAGLVVIAIYNCESMEQLTKRFAENSEKFGGEPDVPFRLAVDGGEGRPIKGTDRTIPGATYAAYDISAYPTTVLIGRQGEIIEKLNLSRAKEKLESMLGVTVEATLSGWRRQFYQVYRLEEGEMLKRIAPPFIPERKDYYKQEHSHQAELIERPPDYFTFHWDGELKNWGLGFGSGKRPLNSVLNSNLSIDRDKFEGPEELLKIDVPGDWIVRKDVSEEEKLKALERILADEMGRNIRFVKRTVEREAIVAIGRFQYRRLPVAQDDRYVHMFSSDFDLESGGGGGTADSVSEFLQALGNRVRMPVIDETEPSQQVRIPYRHHRSAYLGRIEDPAEKREKLTQLLDNLSRQTDLRFTVEPRPVEIWFVTEDKTEK